MEQKFKSEALPLAQLLERAEKGILQLPDFQRGWVWDDDHIRSLLASISLSYPIGAVMTLAAGNPDVNFKARLLEGVTLPDPPEPEWLLLDGQQRLTSLFQALTSSSPVCTRNSRGKELQLHYYAKISSCIDPAADREEEGIVSVQADRKVWSDFGRTVELDVSTRDREIAEEMFPLEIVLDSGARRAWRKAYLDSESSREKRWTRWDEFEEKIVVPFEQYQVPVIDLARSTKKEAVCQVFEKVNTGGVTLTVFELLTATYAADDFELRKDWDERQKRFTGRELLSGVDATSFLQVVTLLATYARRRSYMKSHPLDDKAPAVSCKRRDVLRLDLEDYREWADVAEKGLLHALSFLHTHYIFRHRDLPYATQLVPLGAIFGWLREQADTYAARQQLAQWFWCGVLGEMYGGATETRLANDLEDCISWIRRGSDSPQPRTVQSAQFQAERLLTLRTRNSAAYKGLHALQMKQGARDFRSGQPIDVQAYLDHAIDVHHVFPRAWCERHTPQGKSAGGAEVPHVDLKVADCVVNKTPLDAKTNRYIRGEAPSVYLLRIEEKDGLETHRLNGFLRSHSIDPEALRRDDFAQFFNRRFERLLEHVATAMGKPVNRRPERDESPFAKPDVSIEQDVRSLIEARESEVVEFKSTARHNLRTEARDEAMTWAVVKTIAAFMNTAGGTLLIGVADDGTAVGIEADYLHVKGQDRDGWELWLTGALKRALGPVAVAETGVGFCTIDGRTVARVEVRSGAEPVFARQRGEQREFFFARLNNSTEELAGLVLLDYRRKRWPE